MDEENNNVDDEDDEDEEEEMQPISIRASTPADNFIEDDDPDIEDFPQGVDNEVVVDNDEDVRVNVSREGDVEIVGEDIAVEIIAERAIVPDTEDDTDDDIADDDEYPLPVINTATTEEVLGISSDSDTGGTVEAAEDTLEAGGAGGAASREMSPQPGPSTSGQHQSVVRCSRGKRLPWRDTDYNDTSDSEEDEVRGPDPSPGSREAAVVTPAVGVITTSASSYGGIIIQPSRELTSVPRSRGLTDFNERRFWRQLSSNNEDLGSIEPTVSSSSTPELRVRSVSSLQPSWWRRRPTPPPPLVMTISPATPSQPAPSRQGEEGAGSSSSVPTLPNTTIRRILPINTTDLVPAPAPPAPVEPARLEAVRSPSPVSPPQSAMYSPVQLPTFPPVNAPRFEPGAARVEGAAPRDLRARVEGAAPEMLERIRDGARDLDRIDRILELSRRSRFTAELESERRREAERTRREWLTDLQRERELTERTIYTGRRSLERAETVMSRGRDTGDREERSWARARALRALHAEHPAVYLGGQRVRTQEDDVTNEFVRDTADNDDTEDTPPASKRPRVDGDQPSSQYDADMAEALSRSLADQGGADTTTTTAAARDTEPQPGCSHWGQTSGTPAPAQEADTAATAAATPATPAAAEAATPGSPVYEPPDYEAMYRQLAASNRKLVQELQSSLECPVCLETIRSAPVKCCRNGHLICNVCITRAQICPTCRAPMGISMSMKCVSHVANRLIDLLPHPCTNKDRGCPVEELLTVLTTHETECRYRDVRCPVGYCPDTVPMSSLATHLSSQPHSFPTRGCSGAGVLSHVRALPASTPVSDLNNATFFMRSFDPVRFTHAGAVFYLQTIVSADRRFLHSFVQLEGSRAECGRWWVRLSVQPCSAFTQSQASVTVRPVTLDHHCRDDLQTIGHAQITPQG